MAGMDAGDRPDTEQPDLVETLRGLGVSEELLEQAVARGDPIGAVFEQVLSPEKDERTVSARDIEARGGMPLEHVSEMMAAFGLRVPEPDEPAFTNAEAEALVELGQLAEIYRPELAVQVARVYGRLLGRIAQTEVQLFRAFVEPNLRDRLPETEAAIGAIRDAFARLMPLSDPLLVGVHRRWVEHQVAQAAVRDAERGWSAPLPGAVEVAFLFCDLKDFTRFVDLEGDEAGVRAIDLLAAAVVRERGSQFLFTKSLGDGVMLAYSRPADAIEAGMRIISALAPEDIPMVHASVHSGVAIAREGDYFGHAVNLAARVLGVAGPGELLATRAVHDQCGDRFTWERAGAIRMRGIAGLVELFRLRSGR
jgi:class 3 adenylate cyclase